MATTSSAEMQSSSDRISSSRSVRATSVEAFLEEEVRREAPYARRVQPAATAARVVVDDGMVLVSLLVLVMKDRAQDVGRGSSFLNWITSLLLIPTCMDCNYLHMGATPQSHTSPHHFSPVLQSSTQLAPLCSFFFQRSH